MKKQKSSLCIIGMGYVGLPLALLAQKKGYAVTGIVAHQEKAEMLNKKISPIKDKQIEEDLKKSTIYVTNDYSAIKAAQTIVICVPTPVHGNNKPDLRMLVSAAKSIGKYLQKGQLVILESTVNPGVSEELVIPTIEEKSHLQVGKDFYYAHCPERINPGDAKWHVGNIPRVIGADDERSLTKAKKFYTSILKGKITTVATIKEAEAVKVVENSFRDINIAFVNELALSFSHLGIDVTRVIDAAATKPFAFMPHYPGCGVGGHCIPVDPYYLISYAKKKGFRHEFLMRARKINNYMPVYTADLLIKAFKEKKVSMNSKVAVLGLSYKKDIDDTRESPAFKIIEALENAGLIVNSFDPYVLNKSTVKSLDDALKDVKAVVIATDHKMFRVLTPEIFLRHNIEIVIDGRNCLAKDDFLKAGILYKGIGR